MTRSFFVTAIHDGAWIALAGPFDSHDEACAAVDRARKEAHRVDERAHWYAYGTARAPSTTAVAFPHLCVVNPFARMPG